MSSVHFCDLTPSKLNPFLDDVSLIRRDDGRMQPWKKFWPPTRAERLSIWCKSEFPEVSSWKFDPESPFDRPWRTWTRTSQARAERNPSPLEEHEAELIPVTAAESRRDRRNGAFGETSESDLALQAASAEKLDLAIRRHSMKAINPASFNYLSPLLVYCSEKPYLSRLPCLPGFARTNIVGSSKPILVHDVSGSEHLFTLDTSGFEFVKCPKRIQNWTDSIVREKYIPAVADWLRRHLNCSEVYIYAYNVSWQNSGVAQMGSDKVRSFGVVLVEITREVHGKHRSSELTVVSSPRPRPMWLTDGNYTSSNISVSTKMPLRIHA